MRETTEHRIFCYVVGDIPSNGAWVSLAPDISWEDIEEEMGLPSDTDPVRVSDAEGFTAHFHNRKEDTFDLDAYGTFAQLPDRYPEDAITCFIEWQGLANAKVEVSRIQDYYHGTYSDLTEFAMATVGEKAHPDLTVDWASTGNRLLQEMEFEGVWRNGKLHVFNNI